jgi:hypothetical protein
MGSLLLSETQIKQIQTGISLRTGKRPAFPDKWQALRIHQWAAAMVEIVNAPEPALKGDKAPQPRKDKLPGAFPGAARPAAVDEVYELEEEPQATRVSTSDPRPKREFGEGLGDGSDHARTRFDERVPAQELMVFRSA